MYFKNVKVVNEMGIHSKIATKIIKITTKTKSNIFFEHNNKIINAKSIVAILAAKIRFDDEFKIFTDSEQGEKTVDELADMILNDF